MAISWLSLARQYEAIEQLFQETGEAAVICHQAALDLQLPGSRLLLETPNHRKPLEEREAIKIATQWMDADTLGSPSRHAPLKPSWIVANDNRSF
jgi:hypothetical protein